ncbi:hypothetical protein K505DRAFT_318765 [Melanomma pulvis-pyrius CBS 109.77]|uniref:Uncharacterized protein n=1 Tax=Melanomma pulvis-pyrius CBS 109.77 TaxID=1314802 RepID=A0A6A6WQM6_9PLEO|nr:hypothetical protein K505DRAFT_318765 [Melanomma pulvis-pyrius CBS 109.77]
MQRHIDVYYTTRPKDLDGQDRWMVRGLTVFLYMVILNCPLNPSYGDLGKGQPCFDETAFEIAILRNKMPGGLNEAAGTMHLRIDSAMTEEPGSLEQANQLEDGAPEAAPLSPIQLWYALQVACTERSKTQSIVEGLLGLVEPEMDARKFLIRMGDPAQMVPMEEKEILRHKLRTVLFPEYDTLS